MPVIRERQGDTVIYRLDGPLDEAMVRQFFYLNYSDYKAIGDAIGAVVDLRPMTKVTIAGLRTVQGFMRGVVFDTPVAYLGRPDRIVSAFLSGLEALSSRRGHRFRFFSEEHYDDPLAAAVAWLDAWYVETGRDRAALRGKITTKVPDLPAE
ncbi:MAG: hypothetical protein GX579_21610 [Chloroflexi bacterium]|jgi:hypothetical protein|nr:hypothetical protein [Chloroflexota bacterium]